MFEYFEGKLSSLAPTHAVIDCSGIGYCLQISLFTFSQLKEQERVRLYAHQVVREDALLLFGFWSEEERQVFRELLNVSGVGAGTARMILSSVGPSEIRRVIAGGDLVTLQRIKGIGAKTAQRILVDLQDKFSKSLHESPSSGALIQPATTEISEALTALLTLGFNRSAAEKALKQAEKNLGAEKSVEDLIKIALNHI